MMPRNNVPMPSSVANMSLQMFSPRRSVIIDMVMIQLISAILCALFILVLKGNEINQTDASMLLIGVFGSFMMLGTIYTRITRM
jgi:hypothetical protein